MNRASLRLAWIALLALMLAGPGASLTAGKARAQIPGTMTVQGILRDDAGTPVEGTVPFAMELRTATRSLWTEAQSTTLQAGLFTLTLGGTTPIDPALFDAGPVSLVVTVDGEEMAPIPLSAVPYAFRAASADTAENYAGDVDWAQLTGVPTGFADGTDDGNTYAAGAGLALTDNTFAVDTATIQARVTATCAPGQSIRAIGADGSVTCEIDDAGAAGTTYAAGAGLTLAGSTFSVDTAAVQARVSATCAPGQSIRAIAADGAVTCEADDSGLDTTCNAGMNRDGVCMLAYDATSTTDWNTAASTCAGVGGDLCSASQYLALMTANDGWRPNVFYGRPVWTRNFSDNDAGRVWWQSSSDDPTISQNYSYACCRRVTPTDIQARATLVPATGSTRGVLMTYIHNREDSTFPTAAGVCNALRSDLCSTAQYVVLNDAGRFSGSIRKATPALSDNDVDLFDSILGTNNQDNPGWNEYYAFACCASQRPVDGSCPAEGVVLNNVCTVDLHETEDASFFDAARGCGRLGADVCSNSQMQNIRNAGRFAGRQSWTSEGADNDSNRVGGILGSQPDNPNPSTNRFGYACCL